ncbi:hypothetical protein BH11ACT3_BH11ACT3_09840 [soil metagenome]
MTSSHWRLLLSVTVPALIALLAGLTHPAHLNEASAEYWRNLHIVLLFVFPAIGAAPWLLARRVSRVGWMRWVGWVAALGGYLFATCYTALDILAGIGGGTLVLAGHSDDTGQVFKIANQLAVVGVVGLAVGMLAAGILAVRHAGLPMTAGTLLAVAGAALVLPGHVWFPIGTLALALLVAGCVVLATGIGKPRPAQV